MYSNNILNVQLSTTILNAYTKKVWKVIECTKSIRRIDRAIYMCVRARVGFANAFIGIIIDDKDEVISASLSSNYSITFTFGLIPLGKV